jgi:hypothetical protein
MAAITERLHVAEVEPQVRTLFNWDPVVGMQVSFVTGVACAEFREDPFDRWAPELETPEVPNDVWFPSALDTTPSVAFETENPKPAMRGIVAAFDRSAAARINFALTLSTMDMAGTSVREIRATRCCAGTTWQIHGKPQSFDGVVGERHRAGERRTGLQLACGAISLSYQTVGYDLKENAASGYHLAVFIATIEAPEFPAAAVFEILDVAVASAAVNGRLDGSASIVLQIPDCLEVTFAAVGWFD